MKLKNVVLFPLIFSLLFLTPSCTTIFKKNDGIFGKSSEEVQKVDSKIRLTENAQAQSNEDKLKHIGAIATGGVEYALDQIKTNVPPEVNVAKEMNNRVEALAGKPDFKEVEAIKSIVSELLSENEKVRTQGEKQLKEKDKEIEKIQKTDAALDKQREDQIANAMAQANVNAQKADQYKATLGEMDRWGGLGAIWYGLKRFITRIAWGLGIFSVLFIILRLLSTTNPIASAIFGIFDQIGSWIIHTIELIIPKAISVSGNVAVEVSNAYKSTLSKVVDSIQLAKSNAAAAGKQPTLQDALDQAEVSMTPDEKAIVEEIKKDLNWK